MAVVEEKGKVAVTEVQVLNQLEELSLVRLIIETGRTHQIRVHLKHLKAPVLGDAVYGHAAANLRHHASRPYLHAWRLKFPHPMSGALMELEAPIPGDIQAMGLINTDDQI